MYPAFLQSLNELVSELTHTLGQVARPLFFIGHSIGGLVIKYALVNAHRSGRYQAIVDNCHGVTFFGEITLCTV